MFSRLDVSQGQPIAQDNISGDQKRAAPCSAPQRILCKLADGFYVKFRAAVRFYAPRCVIGLARLTTIQSFGQCDLEPRHQWH